MHDNCDEFSTKSLIRFYEIYMKLIKILRLKNVVYV